MEDNSTQQPVESEPVSSGFPVKKILSLVIGLVVLVAIIISIIVFVVPRFLNSQPTDATITYWGVWEDTAPYKELAEEFMRTHPNIKVNIEKQDVKSLGKYIDRL